MDFPGASTRRRAPPQRGLTSVVPRPGGLVELSVAVEHLAVGFNRAAGTRATLTHFAHHVPVKAGLVGVAAFGIPGPHRRMERPADLLIEECVAREIADAVVGPDGNLSERFGARILLEHFHQERLVLPSGGLNHAAGAELQTHPLHFAALVHGWERVVHVAIDALRPGEHLTVWEV